MLWDLIIWSVRSVLDVVCCAARQGDQFTSGFVEINPNSKIPALVHRDAPGGKVCHCCRCCSSFGVYPVATTVGINHVAVQAVVCSLLVGGGGGGTCAVHARSRMESIVPTRTDRCTTYCM